MHTITDCPICKKDFMYHSTDIHLFREEPINDQDLVAEEQRDNSNNGWNTKYVICQDCDEKQRQIVDNYDCGSSMCRNGCTSMMNFNEPCAHFKPKQ